MSRSYKHSYVVKDPARKGSKQLANKRVRRRINQDIFPKKGNTYKKIFCSWDISDYKWIWTREDAIEEWYQDRYKYLRNNFSSLEEYLKYWEKCVKRK